MNKTCFAMLLVTLWLSACASSPKDETTIPAEPLSPTNTRVATVSPQPPLLQNGMPISGPEEEGMDAELLREGLAMLDESPNLHSMIILRNGAIVFEKYYNAGAVDKAENIQSITKSILSALVGIAIREGYLDSVGQKLSEFYPQYFPREDDARKDDLNIYHFLTMTAGFEWEDGPPPREDQVSYTMSLPLEASPGEAFNYNSFLPMALSYLLTQESGVSTKEFAEHYLFGPLDITVEKWEAPYSVNNGCCYLWLTPRDLAKIGLLYLNQGEWNGTQIIPAEWVQESTSAHIQCDEERSYGYYWWLREIGGYEILSASGRFGQTIHLIPELNAGLVTTKAQNANVEDDDLWNYGFVEEYLIPSIVGGD